MRPLVTLQAPTRGCLVFRCRSTHRLASPSKRDALTSHPSSAFHTTTNPHYPRPSRDWEQILQAGRTESTRPAPRTTLVEAVTKPAAKATEGQDLPMADNTALWDRLRAWIDEKEEYERIHKEAAPLTPKELSAIRSLVPLDHTQDPEMDGKDWVSALLTLLQQHKLDLPRFEDEAVPSLYQPNAPPHWRVWCVYGNGDRFPRLGFGYNIGEGAPDFKVKKTAKQFAAQQAYKYLKKEPLSVLTPQGASLRSGTQEPSRLPSLSPTAKRVKLEPHSPSLSTTRNISTTTSTATNDSIFSSVDRTAISLGMEAPRIESEPDENVKEGFYKGRATFKPGAKVPEGLGNVSGVLGKQECKLQVAQTVLKWMQEEQQRRESLCDSLLDRAG